jgi:3-dehydroquinate synthetase
VEKSGLPENEVAKISAALDAYRLPSKLDTSIETEAIVSALKKDKKFAAGGIRFVLLRRLGDAFVSDAVTEADIRRAIEGLR